jgi:gas vesicle protein
MHALTTTQGIVALGAAAVALVALLFAIVLGVKLRRMRSSQRAVLGDGQRDLVTHAEEIQTAFTQMRDWVEESIEHFERRMGEVESRVDGCVAYSALVRYDAYNELSGQQSSSMALLDSRKTGLVLSSIVHRDQARLYVKELHEGEASLELSPEEQSAVEQALGRPAARA